MFFTSPALLMQGSWFDIAHVFISASFGIFLLSSTVQAWFFGQLSLPLRLLLMVAALGMIEGGWMTDGIGLAVALLVWALQKRYVRPDVLARGGE